MYHLRNIFVSIPQQCFDEAEKPFDEHLARERRISRDDWAHGSMLIINELLRCSNIEGERVRQEMEDVYQQQHQHEKSFKVGTIRVGYH